MSSAQPHPSRRSLLGWGLAAVTSGALAGCGVDWSKVRVDTGRTPTPPSLAPEDLARFAAVDLIGAALATARGGADPVATTAVALHEAHLRELGPLPGPVPSGSPTPSGWPTTTPTAAAELVAAEQAAVVGLLRDVQTLEPGLATLLASIASSCAGLAVAAAGTVDPPLPPLTGSLTPEADEEAVAAMVALIGAERRAGYAYGPVAAGLAEDARPRAVAGLHRHSDTALDHQKLLGDAGFSVPAAPAAYDVPVPTTVQEAAGTAAQVEAQVARAAADVARTGVTPLNLAGLRVLVRAGMDQASWAGPLAFPGLPELS